MHLLHCSPILKTTETRVPPWMQGAFQRRCISFADGYSDIDTRVFWLQSDNLTIDLRLPRLTEQLQTVPEDYAIPATLAQRADYEGWYAHAQWQNQQLSWHDGCAYQLHNRWPEPALLQRIGNCMVEFAPSGAYVEDWRLLNNNSGPLIGLELESERDLDSGEHRPRQGALIICGDYAGLVIDRAQPVQTTAPVQAQHSTEPLLCDVIADPSLTAEQRHRLMDFETSIGVGNSQQGYRVVHALNSERCGEPLIDLSGFMDSDEADIVLQQPRHDGRNIERRFRIDSWYPQFDFSAATPCSTDAIEWMRKEEPTLARYKQILI